MSLSGKVALITGGSKGIGKAIALRYAAEGAYVVITYGSDTAAAEKTIEEIGKDTALGVQADASKLDAIDKVVSETVSRFGRIDILVPCAGVMGMSPLEKLTEEFYDNHIALNTKGPLFLVQKALPHMKEGSRIIFFSTNLTWAHNIGPPYLSYLMSKGAVEQMARVLSKELAPKGINVNTISPGPTETELFVRGKSEQVINNIKALSPANRLGQPNELAEVALFLALPANSWVIGQNIRVNGAGTV